MPFIYGFLETKLPRLTRLIVLLFLSQIYQYKDMSIMPKNKPSATIVQYADDAKPYLMVAR